VHRQAQAPSAVPLQSPCLHTKIGHSALARPKVGVRRFVCEGGVWVSLRTVVYTGYCSSQVPCGPERYGQALEDRQRAPLSGSAMRVARPQIDGQLFSIYFHSQLPSFRSVAIASESSVTLFDATRSSHYKNSAVQVNVGLRS
jgi:hypothetical protein